MHFNHARIEVIKVTYQKARCGRTNKNMYVFSTNYALIDSREVSSHQNSLFRTWGLVVSNLNREHCPVMVSWLMSSHPSRGKLKITVDQILIFKNLVCILKCLGSLKAISQKDRNRKAHENIVDCITILWLVPHFNKTTIYPKV